MPEPTAASTYRLQLTPTFGFAAAADVVPYLRELGVTHAYLSPVWEAQPGSTHGYDVTDPTRLRTEFGGREAFDRLCEAAAEAGLKLVLDVVPNHMAATDANPWWRDPERRYMFDIDEETGRYRRFFEIDDLVAMRQEDPRVFDETHSLVRELATTDCVDGLRIDHIDGIRDPQRYLEQLHAAAPDAWIVVEKILLGDEPLPATWPVLGTTGYEFAATALRLFVRDESRGELDALYRSLTGDERTFDAARRAGKEHALRHGLAPDVARVARAFGDEAFSDAIVAIAADWPVYRSYVRGNEATERLQLLTGPAMAKGVEDRAFYDYTRFIALNEVGGDPDCFDSSPAAWHAACRAVADHWPHRFNTTATHDTKRGEDVRTRLAVISERTDWWAEQAGKWMARHDTIDGPTAYLLLQTIVGAWPLDEERLGAYMQKAAREAGAHTSWADPDDNYERALAEEARRALQETDVVESLVAPLVEPGRVNSLAQTLLRLTAPGTPDTYQGTEAWDLSLVDPDNRRPVDFVSRKRTMAAVRSAQPEEWLRRADDAWPKMAVVSTGLVARRERPHAFDGGYEALATDSDAVVAFARGDDVVVVVPTMNASRRPVGDVALPQGRWVNRFTNESFGRGRADVAEMLARFPVALLVKE